MNYFSAILFILLFPFIATGQVVTHYSTLSEKSDGCSHHGIIKPAGNKTINPLLNDYDISFTKIDIESENASDYISGYTYVEAQVTADQLNTFCIELSSNMTIDSVLFDGIVTDFAHSNDEILIDMDVPVQNGISFTVTIYYDGFGHGITNYAGGIHHVSDDELFNFEPLTYSFTQPFGASLWFPCKQVLSDKIDSLYIFITTNNSYKVSSNGLLTEVIDLPDNKTRYEWKSNYPIAYYLVAFNVFNYTEYSFYTYPEEFSDSILIQNFMVDQDHINAMKDEVDKTHDAMNLYCNLFGMYPFKDEKYGHSIWGHGFGMEHQTLTSMPYNIDFRRLSHELSHQWFGNSVTCGSWQDIWLNEGFATYFDYLALKLLISDEVGEERMEYYHSKAMEYSGGSVYIPEEDANNPSRIFNYKLSYCKAGAVMKMLRWELQDDDLFWQILHNYYDEYKYGFAITQDFQDVVEETSGNDYDYFFDQWIYGEGFPTLHGYWYQQDDSLTVKINEHTSQTNVTPLFKMLVQYRIELESGEDTLILLSQTKKNQTHRIYFTDAVEDIIIDPANEILNDEIPLINYNPNGIGDNEVIGCSVYPNPSNGSFNISVDTECFVELFDIRSQLIETFNIKDNKNIQLSRPGIYFLKFSNSNILFVKKVIIE